MPEKFEALKKHREAILDEMHRLAAELHDNDAEMVKLRIEESDRERQRRQFPTGNEHYWP